jgi:hypothetical protein
MQRVESSDVDRLNLRSLFSRWQSHPLAIDLFLSRFVGEDYQTWEPEALWIEIGHLTRVPSISDLTKQKICALQTVRRNDRPFLKWDAFEKVVAVFNNVFADFGTMQKLDLGQLVVGVSMMRGLREHHFSDEVTKYIAASLLHDGVMYAPEPIDFVNHELLMNGPWGLHQAVGKALKSKAQPEEGTALGTQLAKIAEAQLYSAEMSQRLLDYLQVVHESAIQTSV